MAAGGGGSWKVAFADFMTALMALFLVLWIVGQDQEVKGAVEEYFKNPWKAALSDSTGIIPVKNADVTTSQKSHFENPSAVPLETVRQISEDLQKTFIHMPDYRENNSLAIESTPEGVKISFFDGSDAPVFERDSALLTTWGKLVLRSIDFLIDKPGSTPLSIEIQGHTEAGFQFEKPRANYGGWELSSDRALAARKYLLGLGFSPSRIISTSGFGDSRPMKSVKSMDPAKPERPIMPSDPANRRVTIFLHGIAEQE